MFFHILAIDFRNDQRHAELHSESRGIVDHDRTGIARLQRKSPRNISARAEKRDVDLGERVFAELFDGDGLIVKSNVSPHGSRGTQGAQTGHWKTPPLQYAQELGTNRAGRAYHRDVIAFSHRQADCSPALAL